MIVTKYNNLHIVSWKSCKTSQLMHKTVAGEISIACIPIRFNYLLFFSFPYALSQQRKLISILSVWEINSILLCKIIVIYGYFKTSYSMWDFPTNTYDVAMIFIINVDCRYIQEILCCFPDYNIVDYIQCI